MQSFDYRSAILYRSQEDSISQSFQRMRSLWFMCRHYVSLHHLDQRFGYSHHPLYGIGGGYGECFLWNSFIYKQGHLIWQYVTLLVAKAG